MVAFEIVARRIEHRQDAEQRPTVAAVLGAGDAERARTLGGEFVDGLFNALRDIGRRLDEIDDRPAARPW